MSGEAHRNEDWTPGDLTEAWRIAIIHLDLDATNGFDKWQLGELVNLMTDQYPEALVTLATNLLNRSVIDSDFGFPHNVWDHLHRLTPDAKTEIWRTFKDIDMSDFLRELRFPLMTGHLD